MELITLKDHIAIAVLVKLVSQKRKAFLHRRNIVYLNGDYWEGGSRASYFLIDIATKKVTPFEHGTPPQFGGKSKQYTLQPGQIIVEAGVFCGKAATPTVYVREDEMI